MNFLAKLFLPLFPYHANSLREFAEIVKQEKCKEVVIKGKNQEIQGSSALLGFVDAFQYILEFIAETPDGRKVLYRFPLFISVSSTGEENIEEREEYAIMVFIYAEDKARALRKMIPGIPVLIIGPEGKIIDRKMRKRLFRDLERLSRRARSQDRLYCQN